LGSDTIIPVKGSTFCGKFDGPYTTGVGVAVGRGVSVTVGVSVGVAILVGSGVGVLTAGIFVGIISVGVFVVCPHPTNKNASMMMIGTGLSIFSSTRQVNWESYRVQRFLGNLSFIH